MTFSADDDLLFLAVDQGSSATKILLVDRKGRIRGSGREEVGASTSRAIIASVRKAASAALKSVGTMRGRLILGIANQRSTLCRLVADGRPVGPIVSWWERTGATEESVGCAAAARFRRLTGLPVLPNWWGGKLAVHAGSWERAGTVDTLLTAWMSSGQLYKTDVSNAARTGLVDLRTLDRSATLLRLLNVPPQIRLPEITSTCFEPVALDDRRLGRAAALGGMIGDAGATLLGATGGERGLLCLTLGTGAFMQLPVNFVPPPGGLYLAPAWSSPLLGGTTWTLEAAIPGFDSALTRGLAAAGLSKTAHQQLAPRQPPRNLEALLTPSGAGPLGPAHWEGVHLRGPWRRASNAARLGALLDALAILVARGVRRFPQRPRLIVAGGGLSRSAYLLRRIADFSGVPVAGLRAAEASAWGAARLAAFSVGVHLPLMKRGRVHKSTWTDREGRRRIEEFEKEFVDL